MDCRGPQEGRRATRWGAAYALVALLAGTGCGGGPRLSNLRCSATAPCQDPEDPFRLHLSVDFDDASGTLGTGALEIRLDGATQLTLPLADLFARGKLAPATQHGSLDLDDEVVLDTVGQGQTFAVSLLAHDGNGQQSNEPQLSFRLKLGAIAPTRGSE